MFHAYKKEIIMGFSAFFIFFLLSLFITFPLFFKIGDITTGLGDELVIAWIQNWVIHALSTDPLSIFESNLYYPYHNTLAFTETFILTSILAIPIRMIIGEPISTVNFTFISSLIFLGFSMYLLCFYLTRSFFASIFSGILVIFSPAVLDKATHLQILAIQWVPLAILFYLLFLNKQKSRYLTISLLFFVMQTYNSFMPGYFILFSYVTIFLFSWFYKRKQTIKIITKKNILLSIISFLLIFPIILPYYQVSKEFNYTRDIRDAVHFALQSEDLLYTTDRSRFYKFFNNLSFNQQSQNNEFKPGYVGLVFTGFIIFVFWRFIKYFKKNGYLLNSFITVSLLGLILSFGPVLHLGRQTVHMPFPVPLPYAFFYYILPGFQGFRNSARWEMLFIMMIAVAIALILHEIAGKYSLRKQAVMYFFLILGCIVEFNFPLQFINVVQRKDFPQIYSWLNTTPKNSSAIIMPVYNWNSPYASEEIKREYFSTNNFRRTVNGYSGFSPPPWQELLSYLHEKFPEEASLKKLKGLKVTYLIVDKRMYDKGFKEKYEKQNGEVVINKLEENSSIQFIQQIEGYYIFKL